MAFHVIFSRSRVMQIFFFFFGLPRGKKIITKICAGNKQTKNPKCSEREEDDSWCRIRKVLTWGCTEDTSCGPPHPTPPDSEGCKKTKVAFHSRWFIVFYLVTFGVTFQLQKPVAPMLTFSSLDEPERPERATSPAKQREVCPFRWLRWLKLEKKQFLLHFPSSIRW